MSKSAAVLYDWPAAAAVGSVVPKSKFYETAELKPATRERFVQDVQRITWAYKLAESTIHLPGADEVPEIQVFEVVAKGEDVPDDVLTAIARAVRSPIIFEIVRGRDERRTAVCFGSPGCFSAGWVGDADVRVSLPTSIDLGGLYLALVGRILPVSPRVGERLPALVERLRQVRRLPREITALERRLRAEPQLNRKVELRRTLRAKQAALADLTDSTTSPTMTIRN